MTGTEWVIVNNGRPEALRYPTRDAAEDARAGMPWLAGAALAEVPAHVWSEPESANIRERARYAFRDHGHGNDWDDMTRDSCGACALNGWRAFNDGDGFGPNYAGWERLFVQSGRTIPREYAGRFFRTLVDAEDNERYRVCLMRDIVTYGLRVQS